MFRQISLILILLLLLALPVRATMICHVIDKDLHNYNWSNVTDADIPDNITVTGYVQDTDIDTEAELESLLTDVTDVFTNNDTIDISDNTNLSASDGITLTGDNLTCDLGTSIESAEITNGTIVNADIADDTIAEVKLDIYNAPSDGYYLKYTTANGMEWTSNRGIIGHTLIGNGSTITTGYKGHMPVYCDCTIVAAGASTESGNATITVDVWFEADPENNGHPTDADSITASAPITLSDDDYNRDTTLTGWTTSLTAGGELGFNVDSCSAGNKVVVWVEVEKQ